MSEFLDVSNLSRDDLLEEYQNLLERFRELREASEEDAQRMHELKRALDVATAAEAYLSQELEQLTGSESAKEKSELRRAQMELEELRRKHCKLEKDYLALQQDCASLSEENATLSSNLEGVLARKECAAMPPENALSTEEAARLQLLEKENIELLNKLDEFQERSIRNTLTIAEAERNIEILSDQVMCLEENLRRKREELEEKVQLLECTQEQLSEANARVAMLTAAPENNERKGNSLFAEVDDQRQAMKQLLAAQKKSYLQMKKIFNESEHEIRRLKRENISMHTELEACTSIFCNADKIYQEKLNERIRHLIDQNEELERKLAWTQERLKEMASAKEVLWLDSMLNFCKKETVDLKQQLHSARLQKASLEEQLRNVQQELARWRFESLKSRCLLIDREHLLDEHRIPYKSVEALEFKINAKDLEVARPRIVNIRTEMGKFAAPCQEGTEFPEGKTIREDNQIKTEPTDPDVCTEGTDQAKKSQNEKHRIEEYGKSSPSSNNRCRNIEEECKALSEDDKENTCDVLPERSLSGHRFKLALARSPSPMRPSQRSLTKGYFGGKGQATQPLRSIVSKQRDLLGEDNQKSVKFSSQEATVHQLSSDDCLIENASKDDAIVNNAAAVKRTQAKSSVVVRRVVVSSKSDIG